MKKILLLPILATGLMVSQAWGAACSYNGKAIIACEYSSGCFELTEEYTNVPDDASKCKGSLGDYKDKDVPACKCNDDIIPACKNDGKIYSFTSKPTFWSGTPWGKGVTCSSGGGTLEYSEGCNKWCQYDSGCNEIKPDPTGIYGTPTTTCAEAEANCPADKTFTTSTCSGSNPNPPNPGGSNCCWEANEYNTWSGYCGPVTAGGSATTEGTEAYCLANSGVLVSSCGGCQTTGQPPSPVIISGHSVGLTVVPNGNTLHIISERTATVELFSMTGAKVFSGKVTAGNSTLSLEKQRQGVYYAVVRSGSQKQTVKVVLK